MKRLLAAIVLTLAMSTAIQAVDITITFTNATPQEARAAAWFLEKTNAVRIAHNDAEGNPLEPFATIGELLVERIERMLPAWITAHAEATQQEVKLKALWEGATPEQQAAAIAALQQ